MIKWILLTLLLLLLLFHFFFRFGVEVCYDHEGGWVKLRLGPGYVRLWPSQAPPEKEAEKQRRRQERKENKQKKKSERQSKKPKKPKKERPKPTPGGLLSLALELIPVVQEAGRRTKERIQIDRLILRLSWAEEDPADAAIHYGRGWAVLEWLLAVIEGQFTVREKELSAEVDFLSEAPRLYVRAGLSMTPAQLAAIALPAGIQTGKILWRRKKQPPAPTEGATNHKEVVPHGKESSGQ